MTLVGPLTISSLGRGRSNLTYRVADASGRQVVVRRPPAGPILPTAHDVVREARIVRALAPTLVPVPDVLAIVDDPSLIGAPFAVYEMVEGAAVIDRASAERSSVRLRRTAGQRFAAALAALPRWNASAGSSVKSVSNVCAAPGVIVTFSQPDENVPFDPLPKLSEKSSTGVALAEQLMRAASPRTGGRLRV